MIKVFIPNSYIEERKYVIHLLIHHFLGLRYSVENHDGKDYILILENQKKLVFRDGFFSQFCESESYIDQKHIPGTVLRSNNPFIVEKDQPVIFGTQEMVVSDTGIICGIDIFASSFFMLTRWEEYVIKERDVFNRFPATASLAYKQGFLDRPVVNEYVEMLWNMLKYLGIEQDRKPRTFELMLTHDVDYTYRWTSLERLIRSVGADLVKRRNVRSAISTLRQYYFVKKGKLKDPFDTFDKLMDLSEKNNVKSRFYFMSGGETLYDNHYRIDDLSTRKIIDKIKRRGHIIGFHPSYNSYNNPELWSSEKERLEHTCGFQVTEGRQHYLRFEAPVTWNIWENNNMIFDCTLSYADREGFRCGTCYSFPVFNFLSRKTLKLNECPLTVMEGSFITYQKPKPQEMLNKVVMLMERVKKYNGTFVFLWHNCSFNVPLYSEYEFIYEEVLNHYSYLKKN